MINSISRQNQGSKKMAELESFEMIDITPVINSEIAVFPGDTVFSQNVALDMKKGSHLTLSSISSTVHLGAHADAPNHYSKDGISIEKRSLDYYFGKAQVIQVELKKNRRISLADIQNVDIKAARVLFKTQSFSNPYKWSTDFMSLSVELVNYLAEKKVKLVGIDTPSIDPSDDQILESHQAVAYHDMAILEGLVLDHVSPGIYQLVALPLPIAGAEASPVRAVLLRERK